MIDLFEKLLNGTVSFVIERIPHEKNRSYFYDGILEIRQVLYTAKQHGQSFTQLQEMIKASQLQLKDRKFPTFTFSSPKKYHSMAYDVALDIIQSLDTRFISGYTSPYFFSKTRIVI